MISRSALLVMLLLPSGTLGGADTPGSGPDPDALSLYVDWNEAPADFTDFLITEIPWIACARDRVDAGVFVLVTTQETGSGSDEYQLQFIGQHRFAGLNDTLRFVVDRDASEDTERRQVVQRLKLGLARFAARTPAADEIKVSGADRAAPAAPADDSWDRWVFSISLNGNLSGEKSQSLNYFWGTLTADRVTDLWKFNAAVQGTYKYNRYEIDSVTTYIDTTRSYSAWCRLVRSLGDHWAVGGGPSFRSSSYSNIDYRAGIGPGLEYSVFPYAQATTRELKCIYGIGFSYQRYLEETIYDKTSEHLFDHSLTVSIDAKQRWGSVYLSLTWSNYLHDLTKNSLNAYVNASLQLVRGLSFDIWGDCGLIHDQLYLSKRGLTPEEILLQIRELSSQYEYWGGFGLTYSFGSRFSRVVNPRFD